MPRRDIHPFWLGVATDAPCVTRERVRPTISPMGPPDRLNGSTIVAAAVADGMGEHLRQSVPKNELASFLSFMARIIDAHLEGERLAAECLEREHLAAERLAAECLEREHLAAERLDRERREREVLPLEQRPPIRLPGGARRSPLRPRGLIVAAKRRRGSAHQCAARRSPAGRRTCAAPSFLENIERELDQLGDPASLTPAELADHLDRIVIAPIDKLSMAEASALLRAVFHPAGARPRRLVWNGHLPCALAAATRHGAYRRQRGLCPEHGGALMERRSSWGRPQTLRQPR